MIQGKVVIEQKGLTGGIVSGLIGGAATGLTGGLGKMLGQLALLSGTGQVIAGGITKIVDFMTEASGILKGTLTGITKLLKLLLKPIGDMLGVALMPMLYILKPIGTFFNILMKPYIKKAMAAMKAGGAFMKLGPSGYVDAIKSFALGAAYLFKPIVDALIKVQAMQWGGILDMLSKIPIIGGYFEGLGDAVRGAADSIINTSTSILDTQLGNVLAEAENKTGKSMESIVRNINSTAVTIAYDANVIKDNIINPFEEIDRWATNDWGPRFTKHVKDVMDAGTKHRTYSPPRDNTYTGMSKPFSIGDQTLTVVNIPTYHTVTSSSGTYSIGGVTIDDILKTHFSGGG